MYESPKMMKAIIDYKYGYKRGLKNHPRYVWRNKPEYLGFKHGITQYKKRKMYEVLTGNKHYPMQMPNKRDIRHIFKQHGVITDDFSNTNSKSNSRI